MENSKNKILILEPELMYREMFSIEAKKLGIKIDFGLNGKDGLTMIHENGAYKMIICNVFMPLMDGVNFVNNLHKLNLKPEVLIMLRPADGISLETLQEQLKFSYQTTRHENMEQILHLTKTQFNPQEILEKVK